MAELWTLLKFGLIRTAFGALVALVIDKGGRQPSVKNDRVCFQHTSHLRIGKKEAGFDNMERRHLSSFLQTRYQTGTSANADGGGLREPAVVFRVDWICAGMRGCTATGGQSVQR